MLLQHNTRNYSFLITVALLFARCNPTLADNTAKSRLRPGNVHDHHPGRNNDVAVIGAGMSGLTAAYNLQKLGYNVVVFEARGKVGGKVDSVYLEEGAPANAFIDLTDEGEARARALCGDERPSELGAVFTGDPDIKALADELNVPYGEVGLEYKVVVDDDGSTNKIRQDDYLAYLAGRINPDNPSSEIDRANEKFRAVVAKYPEIKTASLADGDEGNKEELAKPLSEFAESHGITLLVEAGRPLLTGYGYGYYESVPAGIFLPIIYYQIAHEDDANVSFPCGYQSLLDAMASHVDVRVNARVTKVERTEDYVDVEATGQKPLRFDSLIIAASPDEALSFMSKKEFEYEMGLLSKVSGYKYMSTIAKTVGNDGQYEVEFFADQGWEKNRNNINIAAVTDVTSKSAMFYQIMNGDTSPEDAFDVLQGNAATYWNGTIATPIRQKLWENYFPTVSQKDFPTFYTEIDKLQGHRNTYYVGSYLSFEVTAFCEAHSRQMVKQMFKPVITLEQ